MKIFEDPERLESSQLLLDWFDDDDYCWSLYGRLDYHDYSTNLRKARK